MPVNRLTRRSLTAFVCLALASLGLFSGASSATPARGAAAAGYRPIVAQDVAHGRTPRLSKLVPTITFPRSEAEESRRPYHGTPLAPGTLDPALDTSAAVAAMPAPLGTFEGQTFADNPGFLLLLPPDTNGDIGPNHYVQTVNSVFSVYDRSGTRLVGGLDINSLFQGLPAAGNACKVNNDGDPVVQYDHLADRWMISQFAVSTGPTEGYHECIAVSTGPNPTLSYYTYDFKISQTVFDDYPKFGVWPDGYYMSINQYDPDNYIGPGSVAFERDKMLLGLPAQMVYFDQGKNAARGPQLPSDLDSSLLPPAGAPNTFIEMDDGTPDRLEAWNFHVDWTNTMNSTFTLQGVIPTMAFDSALCGTVPDPGGLRQCIPQPATASRLDALADLLMYRLAYRNYGDHEALVVNSTVDPDGTDHADIRWYELRKSGASPWSIFQQSTYAPQIAPGVLDADHRWVGSAAMDSSGNMALGFSISSVTRFPSLGYAGRLFGDAVNTLGQGEAILYAGGGSQQLPLGRWGDYSSLSVDPVDDCTFWFTSEYYAQTPQPTDPNQSQWHTRVGSFKFAQCGAGLTVTKGDAPDPVNVGQQITYTLTVTNAGPGAAQGVTLSDTLPGGVTFVSSNASQGTCTGTSTVSCSLGALGISGNATVTIVVTANTPGTITNTATVATVTREANVGNNSGSTTTQVNGTSPSPSISPSPTITATGSPVCTITGTNAGETIQGTAGNDTICALGGNDTVFGKGGNDTVFGGEGNDVIYGGAGADSLYGENGGDTFVPGPDNDPFVDGGAGTNGVNYSDATSGVTVRLDTNPQTATGGSGSDTLFGISNIGGSGFADDLTGSSGKNDIDGRGGVDSVKGLGNNDVLIGGPATDTLDGGSGTDTADYATAPAGATVNLGTNSTSNDGYGTSDTLVSIEDAKGSNSGGDSLTGSGVGNKLYGFGGDDTLDGAGASDFCDGGAGGGDTAANCETTAGIP